MVDNRLAHGGELVNLLVSKDREEELRTLSLGLHSLSLSFHQLCDLELLINGAFSPLRGFLTRADYESVLERMRLTDGNLWPIPVCLDVTEKEVERLQVGQSVVLRDVEGFLLAVLHIEDIWPIPKDREAEQVYGCKDHHHPGVDYLYNRMGTHYVGGRIEGIRLPYHFDFKRLRLTPAEARNTYGSLGWRRVVGFQTRNPLHKAQYEMTLSAMGIARANLLLHPIVGRSVPGDIDHCTRVRCLIETSKYYPPNMMLINLLPLAVRMAGPRETLWHAIIHKNYGCTHFIVGRDHAGPGVHPNGQPFYPPGATKELLEAFRDEVGISILAFQEMVYFPEEDSYVPLSSVPPGQEKRSLSGTELRRRLRAGKDIPSWFTFPEVVAELKTEYPPRHQQGFTVFCTGLSGAGKSTIARVLYARFLEMGRRPVTLLDGDIVRRYLSSELGFSKSDRDLNVQRIGFVASEITKSRGIVICAPIAPYAATRRQIRQRIEAYGGFIEVYVATPLNICELRDCKGLYARARAGLITNFTGVDDPYEAPENPEVEIDTTNVTPDEAAQEILLYLERVGYIR